MLGLTHTQISLAQRAASYGALPISVQCGRYFLSSDSLGLLIQKADGGRWVDGCRLGAVRPGVSVVSWWCLGCGSIVSRWCLGCPLVAFRWCLDSVSVVLSLIHI